MGKTKAIPYTVDQTGEDTKPTLDVSAKGLTAKQVQELIEVLAGAVEAMKDRQEAVKIAEYVAFVREKWPDAKCETHNKMYQAMRFKIVNAGTFGLQSHGSRSELSAWRTVAKAIEERDAKLHRTT
jgi:hypothetical protein